MKDEATLDIMMKQTQEQSTPFLSDALSYLSEASRKSNHQQSEKMTPHRLGMTIDDIIKNAKSRKQRPQRPRSDKGAVLCDACGLTFTSKGNLNRHRRVSHQGKRVFCDYKGCYQVS